MTYLTSQCASIMPNRCELLLVIPSDLTDVWTIHTNITFELPNININMVIYYIYCGSYFHISCELHKSDIKNSIFIEINFFLEYDQCHTLLAYFLN